MTPIYYPFTYLTEEIAAAISMFCPKIIRYCCRLENTAADASPRGDFEIETRNLLDEQPEQFEAIYTDYRQWAELQQGGDPTFFKAPDALKIPYYEENSTPHRIRDSIRQFPMEEKNQSRSDLLRSKLFLRLAEDFDRQQWELIKGFRSVSEKEKQMLLHLIGEDADEIETELQSQSSDGMDPAAYMLPERMAAWTRLFYNDPSPATCFLTSSPAAAALLLDHHPESKAIADFAFPLNVGAAIEKINVNRLEIERILQVAQDATTMETTPYPPAAHVENSTEIPVGPTVRLHLYRIPAQCPQDVFKPFHRLFGTGEPVSQPADTMSEFIMGVIEIIR